MTAEIIDIGDISETRKDELWEFFEECSQTFTGAFLHYQMCRDRDDKLFADSAQTLRGAWDCLRQAGELYEAELNRVCQLKELRDGAK